MKNSTDLLPADDRFLERVTVTGANNSVRHEDIYRLAREFPYVEFGIRLDPERQGYPSPFWLFGLRHLAARGVPLAGHIGGEWASDALSGQWTVFRRWPWLMKCFSRLQLDVDADLDSVEIGWPFLAGKKALVIKAEQAPSRILAHARGKGFSTAWLHERLDTAAPWPKADGYAGGLFPRNVAGELVEILQVAEAPAWIEAEFACEEARFIGMAAAFLEAARPWVFMPWPFGGE